MKSQFSVLAMALLATTGIGGCGGGGGNGGGGSQAPIAGAPPSPPPPPASPPAPTPVGFTSYSKQMYADNEMSTPWDIESVEFTFDGDEDPTAYDDLLPAGE